jgi:translation initiation factor IF-2
VKAAAEGLLEPELREEILGHAQVRQVFKVPQGGPIAGCYITDGTVQPRQRSSAWSATAWSSRTTASLEQLKRFKDDAKEVRSGMECGIGLENFHEIAEGDLIETYEIEEIQRTLEDAKASSGD